MTEKRFRKMVLQVKSLEDEFAIYDELEKNSMISVEEVVNLLNELDEKYVDEFSLRETLQQELQRSEEENEELKQRIKSRLHYYRELCNEFDKDDGFTYNIVKRIVEDLEDILK